MNLTQTSGWMGLENESVTPSQCFNLLIGLNEESGMCQSSSLHLLIVSHSGWTSQAPSEQSGLLSASEAAAMKAHVCKDWLLKTFCETLQGHSDYGFMNVGMFVHKHTKIMV